MPNGSAELAHQGPGGLFSSKFVVLFKQRFAAQKDLEISGDIRRYLEISGDIWRYLEMLRKPESWSLICRVPEATPCFTQSPKWVPPSACSAVGSGNFEALHIALTISRRLCQLGNAIRSLATCAEPSGCAHTHNFPLQSFTVTKYDRLQFICCHMLSRNT